MSRAAAIALAAFVVQVPPCLAEWPTEGGDAGATIHVTTLADSGPGSLRAAVMHGGRRRVVFDVGGEIWLKKPLAVYAGHLTIAGETAPSPGISLFGDKLQVRASEVIVRNLRIRVGELPGSGPSARDGISIELGPKDAPVSDVLIDHCSVAWAIDEALGIWGQGVKNVRVRSSILAETLRNSIQPKGGHSMGMLVGKGAENVLVEDNLFISNQYRNPVIDAGASAIVVNNLIVNPGTTAFHVYGKPDAGPTRVAAVGNVVVAGRDTGHYLRSFDHGIDPGSAIYFRDNLTIGTIAFSQEELAGRPAKDAVPFVGEAPVWFDWLKILPASEVEAAVLADVGARPADRDAVDARLVREAATGGGAIRDVPGDSRLALPRPLRPRAADVE